MSHVSFGIIAEYNPFHQGHKYLIDKTNELISRTSASNEADVSVVKEPLCISVMSGNFVQRGDFAYMDKWERAEEAVKNGVDLVVELPQVFSASGAGYFAKGGVGILNKLGCHYLSFGSEIGDIEILSKAASCFTKCEEEYSSEIKDELSMGVSYPAARMKVFQKHFPEFEYDFTGSNDILGIEYIRANMKEGTMVPLAIKRTGDYHNESASRIREEMKKDSEIRERILAMEEKFFDFARMAIISKSADEIESHESAGEGIGNKLKNNIRYCSGLDELIQKVKSKRYTYTRISRLILQLVLDIPKDIYLPENINRINYIRPLAMNERGGEHLKGLDKIQDVSKIFKYEEDSLIKKSLEIDVRASDIYNMLSGRDLYQNSDYVLKPRYCT